MTELCHRSVNRVALSFLPVEVPSPLEQKVTHTVTHWLEVPPSLLMAFPWKKTEFFRPSPSKLFLYPFPINAFSHTFLEHFRILQYMLSEEVLVGIEFSKWFI